MTYHNYSFNIVCNLTNVTHGPLSEESLKEDLEKILLNFTRDIANLDALEYSPEVAIEVYIAKESKTGYYSPIN